MRHKCKALALHFVDQNHEIKRIIMSMVVREESPSGYFLDFLSVASALTNRRFDETTFGACYRLRDSINSESFNSVHRDNTISLSNAVDGYLNRKSINNTLRFRVNKPLAVINGGSLSGLAASIVLSDRFNTVVLEKRRGPYTRENVINYYGSIQFFLNQYGLLEEFEETVAARISHHNYLLFDKSGMARSLAVSDVSHLKSGDFFPFTTEKSKEMCKHDGIYSAPIKDVEEFLVKKAAERGVKILKGATVDAFSQDEEGKYEVRVTTDLVCNDHTLEPDLFFIAEGAHSKSLGSKQKVVKHPCNGENWIFGNMRYSGKKTFVISVIDTSEKDLQIANLIFNAQIGVVNIAVTSNEKMSEDEIQNRILKTAKQVFTQSVFPVEDATLELLTTCKRPVHVQNKILSRSSGDPFGLGDTTVVSSPLAGAGGSLALAVDTKIVDQLAQDYLEKSKGLDTNYEQAVAAKAQIWMGKSADVKSFCVNIFNKEHNLSSQGTSE